MDALDPELPSTKDVIPWQNTTDFDYDFGYAQDILRDVTKLLQKRRRFQEIKRIFRHLHKDIYKFIERLDIAYPTNERALDWPEVCSHYWRHTEPEDGVHSEEEEGEPEMPISDDDSDVEI